MDSKDRKKPKVGAKRFGHRSHVHGSAMVRILGKSGYFDKKLKKEKLKYVAP